jgi:hypothetical protein
MRLEDSGFGDLMPAPWLEIVLCIGLQCAHVVRYQHPLLYPNTFVSQMEPAENQPRIVLALAGEFLEQLAGCTLLLVPDRR